MTDTHDTDSTSPFAITVEEPDKWKRIIKIKVDRAHFDQEYAKRLHRAAKDHVKPGFRKGKIPKQSVERDLGEQLRAQTLEHVVPEAFKAAIVAHDLVPLTDPFVENLVFEPDEPISFDMIIEVRPKITAQGYNDLSIHRREAKVQDADVDDVLERLRESRTLFEKVDRPAQDGDQIVVDLTPLGEDGQPDDSQRVAEQKMELGAETNFACFNEAFVGASAGEERQVEVAYPEDHHNEELRGQTITFHCVIVEVREKIMPELDDAFAASLKEGQTLLEVRQAIRADLLREEESRIGRELDEQIVDALIELNEISVPPSLIEQYLSSGLEELRGRNTRLGRQTTEEEEKHYREVTTPVAERILQGMFIMESVRRQENIQVADEEVEERITEIAGEQNFDLEKYRQYVAQGSERERIVHWLEERKTFDFLLSRATIEKSDAAAE